jgi:hypothetical protein
MSSHGTDPERASDRQDTTDTNDVESTFDSSTPALETTDMSDNEIRRSDDSQEFGDPTAEPAPDPAAPAGATTLSSQLGWPEMPASTSASSPVRSGGAAETTSPIPTTATREVPAARPFRVEPATPVPVAGPQEPTRPALVVVRRGPRPGAIMLGLLSMIVAAYVLVANLTDTDVNLRLVGPPMIGAFGGMLLIVGLVGVVTGRMRR